MAAVVRAVYSSDWQDYQTLLAVFQSMVVVHLAMLVAVYVSQQAGALIGIVAVSLWKLHRRGQMRARVVQLH